MYSELLDFAKEIARERPIWKGGELWTAVIGGIASYFWFDFDVSVIGRIRSHFSDLMSAASIIFGFSLTSYFFCIELLSRFSSKSPFGSKADRVIRWQAWTLICLHILLGFMLGLWSLGIYLDNGTTFAKAAYSTLVSLVLYCSLEILNQVLLVKWLFANRDQMERMETAPGRPPEVDGPR